MKTRLALCLIFLPFTAGLLNAEGVAPHRDQAAAEQAEHPTPESILAAQVSEIATSTEMPRKAKEKRIASAVRLAVIAATTDVRDPGRALEIALGLATVAAQAAPRFAEAIRDAIISIPSIASIEGALPQLQTAVKEGARAASGESAIVEFASPSPRPPQNPEFVGSSGDVVVSPSH
jgi:hypothetical protein